MTDRRYSIIPARAVTDPRIERGDLRVLCFLGMHTDKLGWCFLRQGMIAEQLDCGRSTVQRSLARLIEAGWVQQREFNGQRPHACHAYRVVMDADDPQVEPPEYAVGDDEGDDRCPPVGTSPPEVHHQRAPVPSHERAPPPPEVPTHTWAHNDPDSGGGSGGSARARGGTVSEEAYRIADEIAVIAGHDLAFLPPRWVSEGPPMRVQMMLDHGWQREMMIDTAKSIMARKTDGPPETIRYFEKPFARAHARQSAPAPLPADVEIPKASAFHEKTGGRADWQRSRDDFRGVLGKLGAAINDAKSDAGGGSGASPVRHGAAAGRR